MPWLLLHSWMKEWCPHFPWVTGVPHGERPSEAGLCLRFAQAVFLWDFCGRDFLSPSKTKHRLWGAGLLTPASWSCIATETGCEPEWLPAPSDMFKALRADAHVLAGTRKSCTAWCCDSSSSRWRRGNEWPLSLQAMVKSFILVLLAVLTFTQILISAASVAKVLQAPLQARPWSCLILC